MKNLTYTYYKEADIAVSNLYLRLHTTNYPLDDILYAEVRDDNDTVREESLTLHDLTLGPLVGLSAIPIMVAVLFLLTVVLAPFNDWRWAWYPAYFVLRPAFNFFRKKLAKNHTAPTYKLFVLFREGTIDAYHSNSLFYTQLISRRINNTIKQHMVLAVQTPAANQP